MSDSESNASGKVKRPSNASRQTVYQTESNGSVDEVDCGSRKTSVEPVSVLNFCILLFWYYFILSY